VYKKIKMMVIATVPQKGIPKGSNTNVCKTPATKNNRNDAPIIRLKIK
jgi:hypothetical protein